MRTPRITNNVVDKETPSVVQYGQDEDILTPRQALQNLRRHLMGVVESIDKVLRHSQRPKV